MRDEPIRLAASAEQGAYEQVLRTIKEYACLTVTRIRRRSLPPVPRGIPRCRAVPSCAVPPGRAPWAWPVRPPADRGAWIAASLVLAASLLLFTVRGPRTRLSDDS